MAKIKVVHYINQFFAGLGGEDQAHIEPLIPENVPPISKQLGAALGDDFEIVGTVVCGDSYFGEHMDEAKEKLIEMIKGYEPDLFIAGPAFNAGRYGVAAGTITAEVQKDLDIPALTAMYIENPGADMFKKEVYIVETADSAAGMRKAIPAIAKLAQKLAKGEEIGTPEEEGYLERGIRENFFHEKTGARRAVDMLLKKMAGEEYKTEFPMPEFDKVDPNPAIKDLSEATIGLVTSGGIVPKGNPDRIESSSATKYGEYDIEGVDAFTSENAETAHGGFDPVYTNEDPNRTLPLDVLRDMEKEGKIGKLYNKYYSTVGNGTSVANSVEFASEFAKKMKDDGVDAVVLTST